MASGPHWSPDGKRIAFSGQKVGTYWLPYIVSANGSSQPPQPEAEGTDPNWSPDGNSLLLESLVGAADSSLRILDLKTRHFSIVAGSEGMVCPRWSPDRRYISAFTKAGDRWLPFDFESQTWSELAKTGTEHSSPTYWSRDGKYLYIASLHPEPGVFRLKVGDHKLVKVVSLKGFRIGDPYGEWFSLGPEDEPLLLRDTGGGTEVYALQWEAP